MFKKLLGIGILLLSSALAQNTKITGNVTGTGTFTIDVASNPTFPANFYVSPASGTPVAPCSNGSNSNNGTSVSTPVATVAKAQALAAASGNNGTASQIIAICGGVYEGTSLSFNGPADSGSGAFPVIYEAYGYGGGFGPVHTPVLSGGVQLTGWTTVSTGPCAGLTMPAGSSCWRTSYSGPFFEKLYYNNVFRLRPRLGATTANPQGEYGFSNGAVNTTPYCSTAIFCAFNYLNPAGFTLANYASISAGHVEVHNFNRWTDQIYNIKSVDTTNKVITTTCTTGGGNGNCAPSINNQNPYQANMWILVDNVKELFGCPAQATACPGQYYYDTANNFVYYISNAGENPNTATVEVGGSNVQLFTGTSLQYVTFQGIQFRVDNWTIPSTGYPSRQLDPNLTNALITCDACNFVTWQGNGIYDTTAGGIQITGNSNGVAIINNLFFDIGAYPIRLGVAATNTTGNSNNTVPRNMVVHDNYIYRVNTFLASADGIMYGITNNDTVNNNSILYFYDKGEEVCEPVAHVCGKGTATDSNITISFEDIRHGGLGVMTDLAAIYMSTELGTGNVLNNNRAADIVGGLVQNANQVDPGVHCYYLDDDTGLVLVEINLGYRCQSQVIHMNAGPQVANSPNIIKTNIWANWSNLQTGNAGIVGIQQPLTSVKSFIFENNLSYQENTGLALVNPQTGPPQSSSSSQQQYISNGYTFASTPVFNITGLGVNNPFSTWTGHGEDTAGLANTTLSTFGFAHANDCPAPYDPIPGTCDDWTTSYSNLGFVPFTFAWGPTLPSPFVAPVVPAYFKEAVCQTTTGCKF